MYEEEEEEEDIGCVGMLNRIGLEKALKRVCGNISVSSLQLIHRHHVIQDRPKASISLSRIQIKFPPIISF